MIVSKNRYYKHSRITEVKFRHLLKCFAMDLTATETAQLTMVSVRSINSIYLKLRARLVEICEQNSPYPIANDEGGGSLSGDSALSRYLSFGIYQVNGLVYSEIIAKPIRQLLQQSQGNPDIAEILKDKNWKNYDALVDVQQGSLYRTYTSSQMPAETLNDVDTFWTFAKKRLMQFNGIHRHTFYLHLKETEFRFNHRHENIYKILLKLLRDSPL